MYFHLERSQRNPKLWSERFLLPFFLTTLNWLCFCASELISCFCPARWIPAAWLEFQFQIVEGHLSLYTHTHTHAHTWLTQYKQWQETNSFKGHVEWECVYVWYCACEKRDGNACKSLKGHLWLHRGGSVDVIAGPCYLGRRHWSCLWWIQLKIWNKKSQFAFQTGLYINRVQGPFHPLPLSV